MMRECREHPSSPGQRVTSFAHLSQLQVQSLIQPRACEKNEVHHHVHLRVPRNPSNVTQAEELHGTIDKTLLRRRRQAGPVISCDLQVFHERRRTPKQSSTVCQASMVLLQLVVSELDERSAFARNTDELRLSMVWTERSCSTCSGRIGSRSCVLLVPLIKLELDRNR